MSYEWTDVPNQTSQTFVSQQYTGPFNVSTSSYHNWHTRQKHFSTQNGTYSDGSTFPPGEKKSLALWKQTNHNLFFFANSPTAPEGLMVDVEREQPGLGLDCKVWALNSSALALHHRRFTQHFKESHSLCLFSFRCGAFVYQPEISSTGRAGEKDTNSLHVSLCKWINVCVTWHRCIPLCVRMGVSVCHTYVLQICKRVEALVLTFLL